MLYSLCEADFEVAMIVNVEIFLFNFVVGFFSSFRFFFLFELSFCFLKFLMFVC